MEKTATLIMLDKPILVNEEQPAQTDYAYKNGEITFDIAIGLVRQPQQFKPEYTETETEIIVTKTL